MKTRWNSGAGVDHREPVPGYGYRIELCAYVGPNSRIREPRLGTCHQGHIPDYSICANPGVHSYPSSRNAVRLAYGRGEISRIRRSIIVGLVEPSNERALISDCRRFHQNGEIWRYAYIEDVGEQCRHPH